MDNELKEFEDENDINIRGSVVVSGFLTRIQFSHQQVFLIFVVVFGTLYFIWKSAYSFLSAFLLTVAYISRKAYDFLVTNLRRTAKKVKCKMTG